MKSHVKCLRLVVSICVLQYIFIAYLFIHRNRNHWKESQSQLLQDLVRKDPETQTTLRHAGSRRIPDIFIYISGPPRPRAPQRALRASLTCVSYISYLTC